MLAGRQARDYIIKCDGWPNAVAADYKKLDLKDTHAKCRKDMKRFVQLGPEPAFGRLGLGGSSGGYSSHGYTSHASLRAFGAQLEGDRLCFRRLTKHF